MPKINSCLLKSIAILEREIDMSVSQRKRYLEIADAHKKEADEHQKIIDGHIAALAVLRSKSNEI